MGHARACAGFAAALLAGCSLDGRNPGLSDGDGPERGTGQNQPAPCPLGSDCPEPMDEPRTPDDPRVDGQCGGDFDCAPDAPTCVGGRCECSLSADQLQSDANNCGSCGYRCGSGAICENAACEVVDPIVPGSPGMGLTSGGTRMRSSRFTIQVSASQAPGGNDVYASPRYRLQGGLVGTTQ